MHIRDILNSAKAPAHLAGRKFGQWEIAQSPLPKQYFEEYGREDFICLFQRLKVEPTWDNIHLIRDDGKLLDVVMEDSPNELKKHLPIFIHGEGHVLKTGLGLGCVVRGLLAKDTVDKVSVIEIDRDIIDVIGKEFEDNPRVSIYHADALKFDVKTLGELDYAWHDIWVPENKGLQALHAKLLKRYHQDSLTQGAWNMPRYFKKLFAQRISYIG